MPAQMEMKGSMGLGKRIVTATPFAPLLAVIATPGAGALEYRPSAVWGSSGDASGQFDFTFAGGIDVDAAGDVQEDARTRSLLGGACLRLKTCKRTRPVRWAPRAICAE